MAPRSSTVTAGMVAVPPGLLVLWLVYRDRGRSDRASPYRWFGFSGEPACASFVRHCTQNRLAAYVALPRPVVEVFCGKPGLMFLKIAKRPVIVCFVVGDQNLVVAGRIVLGFRFVAYHRGRFHGRASRSSLCWYHRRRSAPAALRGIVSRFPGVWRGVRRRLSGGFRDGLDQAGQGRQIGIERVAGRNECGDQGGQRIVVYLSWIHASSVLPAFCARRSS